MPTFCFISSNVSGISARRTNFKDLSTVFMLAWCGEYLSNNDNGIWKSIFVQKTIASVNVKCVSENC